MEVITAESIVMETQSANTNTAGRIEEVFTGLANQHLDEVYNYARYMVLDYDEAQDITQKTFFSLYQNLKKLDTSVSLKPWLFRVARNHCLDYLKKKKALQFSEVEEQVLEIPENDVSLEQQLDDNLFKQNFKKLIEQLPVQMREVLALKYFEDYTLEQIAQSLNQPLNTVKSNFYRGKERLYRLIKIDKLTN